MLQARGAGGRKRWILQDADSLQGDMGWTEHLLVVSENLGLEILSK